MLGVPGADGHRGLSEVGVGQLVASDTLEARGRTLRRPRRSSSGRFTSATRRDRPRRRAGGARGGLAHRVRVRVGARRRTGASWRSPRRCRASSTAGSRSCISCRVVEELAHALYGDGRAGDGGEGLASARSSSAVMIAPTVLAPVARRALARAALAARRERGAGRVAAGRRRSASSVPVRLARPARRGVLRVRARGGGDDGRADGHRRRAHACRATSSSRRRRRSRRRSSWTCRTRGPGPPRATRSTRWRSSSSWSRSGVVLVTRALARPEGADEQPRSAASARSARAVRDRAR